MPHSTALYAALYRTLPHATAPDRTADRTGPHGTARDRKRPKGLDASYFVTIS